MQRNSCKDETRRFVLHPIMKSIQSNMEKEKSQLSFILLHKFTTFPMCGESRDGFTFVIFCLVEY